MLNNKPEVNMQHLNQYQLWQAINNPPLSHLDPCQMAQREYQRRFVEHQPLGQGLEYPTEVIYELALYSGHDLPVPFQCESKYHVVTPEPYRVLPYETKAGTKHMWCPICKHKEHIDYANQFGHVE